MQDFGATSRIFAVFIGAEIIDFIIAKLIELGYDPLPLYVFFQRYVAVVRSGQLSVGFLPLFFNEIIEKAF